jgi:hypothetical protein
LIAGQSVKVQFKVIFYFIFISNLFYFIGPEATPLTEFILNKKSRREADRMVRRDRDRERRKTDKQRRDRELDRDMKKVAIILLNYDY